MAGKQRFKVYAANGDCIAACKFADDAAVLVSARGEGATIRLTPSMIVWNEGREGFSAGESYDRVAEVVLMRESVLKSFLETAPPRFPLKDAAAYARVRVRAID